METYIFKWDCLVICIVILQHSKTYNTCCLQKIPQNFFSFTYLPSICTTIVYISNAWLVWLIKGKQKAEVFAEGHRQWSDAEGAIYGTHKVIMHSIWLNVNGAYILVGMKISIIEVQIKFKMVGIFFWSDVHQIPSDIYVEKLGTKSDVESSDGI